MEGLLLSFTLLAGVLFIGLLLSKANIDNIIVRKVVHLGVSNWWFLEMYLLSLPLAVGELLLFVILNTFYVFKVQDGIEERKNFGLIYFPIALLILITLVQIGRISQLAALVGVLIMGYGDSCAALVGLYLGKIHFPFYLKKKTLEGFLAMFVVAVLMTFLCTQSIYIALIVGCAGAVLELLTPVGLDNLTVPIITALICEALL